MLILTFLIILTTCTYGDLCSGKTPEEHLVRVVVALNVVTSTTWVVIIASLDRSTVRTLQDTEYLNETRAVFAAFKSYWSQGDIPNMMSLFTDDIRLYWSGMPALIGKDQVRAYLETFVSWSEVDYGSGPELLDIENPFLVYYTYTWSDKNGTLLEVGKCVDGELKFRADNASPDINYGPAVPKGVGI